MIPISVPHLNDEIIRAVTDTLKSGWIGQNKTVEDFERAFEAKFHIFSAIAVNSCTSSLRLALTIAGVGYKDYVITTPNTFEATNTAILECGAIPIFADIQYDTGNIDPNSIRELLEYRRPHPYGDYIPNSSPIKAIMIVHLMGMPCDMDEIYKISREFNIPVIEDCAQAIGATYNGVSVGTQKYGCWSFQVVKQICTGDGGMFTTDNIDIYQDALLRSWFGFRKEDRQKYAHTEVCDYNIDRLGFKYRMNAINASMGLAQLPYVDSLIKARRIRANVYREELANTEGVILFRDEDGNFQSANYMFPIHVQNRDRFLAKMQSKGIEAFIHNIRNDHHTLFGGECNLPNMAKLDKDWVCLPLHHELSLEQQLYIIHEIKSGW